MMLPYISTVSDTAELASPRQQRNRNCRPQPPSSHTTMEAAFSLLLST